MRFAHIQKQKLFVTLLVFLGIVLSACSGGRDRIWLDAEGWRRAVLAGNTEIADQAPFALDEAGNAYFFLVEQESDEYTARVVGLGRDANVFVDQRLDVVMIARPRDPGIFWDGQQLSLFWVEDHALYRLALDQDFQGEPVLLSADHWVGNYAVSVDSQGNMVIWYSGDRGHPGVYALDLNGESFSSVLVDDEGYLPFLQFDSQDDLHAIWIRTSADNTRRSVFYAKYTGGAYQGGLTELIYTISSATTARVEGPKLGLDSGHVYVIWVITHLTGLSVGTSNASYVYFPLGQPELISSRQDLTIPISAELSYSASQDTALVVGDRVILSDQPFRSTTDVTNISVNPGMAGELAVSVRARLPHLRNQQRIQVGVVYLNDGQIGSYQLVSYTIANSLKPTLMQDESTHLYLSWIEVGDDDFRVFYSSTSPDIKAALQSVSYSEVLDIGAEMSFGIFSGMLLVYYPMMWMVIPGMVMAVTSKLRRPDEPLFAIGTVVSLLLSIAAYWFFKLFFLPDVIVHTPFTNYLPMIPLSWYLPMRIIFLLTITTIAAYFAWHFTFARNRRSPFFTLLIFMGIDGMLTMALYGEALFGAI